MVKPVAGVLVAATAIQVVSASAAEGLVARRGVPCKLVDRLLHVAMSVPGGD